MLYLFVAFSESVKDAGVRFVRAETARLNIVSRIRPPIYPAVSIARIRFIRKSVAMIFHQTLISKGIAYGSN